MDFALVFKFIIEALKRENIDFALIGGFALQTVGVTRTTKDIDLLILSKDNIKIKDILLRSGYELIHESEDILNFVSKKSELGRIDFLLAHRKYTLAMLERAEKQDLFSGEFKVKTLKADDLVGLKVQSSSNDPQRKLQDMADIKEIIRENYDKIDMGLIKEYFDLFDRRHELEGIIKDIKDAK